jgi:hypothetical protein
VSIRSEIETSKVQHPTVSDDILRAVCVMVEEAGEALQAALDYTRNGQQNTYYLLHLIREVEQCGAACHRLLDERLYHILGR